jgi:transposase InsO family protein
MSGLSRNDSFFAVFFLDFKPGQPDLDTFRTWYNHVRTHQSLNGLTPAMAWQDIYEPRGRTFWFSEWEGTLAGDLYLG